MRKPRRVAGLQGAGGAVAENSVGTRVSGASAGVVMPEGSKGDLSRGR